MKEITMVITLSREAAEHVIEEVEDYSDLGCYEGPFPPSDKWAEFQCVLREAYDKAVSESE